MMMRSSVLAGSALILRTRSIPLTSGRSISMIAISKRSLRAAVAAGGRAVRLGKRVEDMTLLVGRDANPGVGDVKGDKCRPGIGFNGLDPDADLAFFCKFDRIADQVGQDLTQPAGIADQRCRQ